MPRKRTKEWAWLEGTNVYFKKGRYVMVLSRDPHVEQWLAPGNATRSQVWSAWEQHAQRGANTLRGLVSAYLASEDFRRLKPKTQDDYRYWLEWLCDWPMPKLKAPFGSLLIAQIGNKTIQSAYDQQFDPESKNVGRNRKFTVLKAVFSWGIQRHGGVEKNPVVGLRMLQEKARTRCPDDKDYAVVYNAARPEMQLLMEAQYLLRLRPSEATEIHRRPPINPNTTNQSFVTRDGVQVVRGKGSRPGLVEWSDRLRAWNDKCQAHNRDKATVWQIRTSSGSKVTKSTRDNMWRRIWEKLAKQYEAGEIDYLPEYFTMHDLKAKAITEGSVKDTHKSRKMLDTYDRAARKETPTR